jgi:hypothetical protein
MMTNIYIFSIHFVIMPIRNKCKCNKRIRHTKMSARQTGSAKNAEKICCVPLHESWVTQYRCRGILVKGIFSFLSEDFMGRKIIKEVNTVLFKKIPFLIYVSIYRKFFKIKGKNPFYQYAPFDSYNELTVRS